MFGNLLRRLFQRVSNRTGSGSHSVHTFQFQWKGAQLIGKLCYGPASYAWLWYRSTTGPMQPPLEVRGGLKTSLRVLFLSEPVRVKNADHAKSFWKIFQAFFELTL